MMVEAQPLIDQPPVRLRECRHGPMLYLTTDLYIGRSLDLYGEFSEGEIELLVQLIHPGDTVLDIGANVGTSTVPLARAVGGRGRLLAFEPQGFIFQILNANIALNGLTHVVSRQAAVGRAAGEVSVPRLDPFQPQNFGGLSLHPVGRGETVPVVATDDLALDACHLIKIDVEGMEGEVIGGSVATIARHRPHLYVENDRRDRSAALIGQLLDLDYRLFWHLPELYNPANFRGNRDNVFGGLISLNMLGIHRSRPCVVPGLHEIESVDEAQRWFRNEIGETPV